MRLYTVLICCFTLTALIVVGAESPPEPNDATAVAETPQAPRVLKDGDYLECFICNSNIDWECGDDFDEENLSIIHHFKKNCTFNSIEGPDLYCKKVKMWLRTETRVSRSCGHKMRTYDEPCYQSRSDDHIIDTCQCEDHGCNSAPILSSSAVFLIFGAFMLTLVS